MLASIPRKHGRPAVWPETGLSAQCLHSVAITNKKKERKRERKEAHLLKLACPACCDGGAGFVGTGRFDNCEAMFAGRPDIPDQTEQDKTRPGLQTRTRRARVPAQQRTRQMSPAGCDRSVGGQESRSWMDVQYMALYCVLYECCSSQAWHEQRVGLSPLLGHLINCTCHHHPSASASAAEQRRRHVLRVGGVASARADKHCNM